MANIILVHGMLATQRSWNDLPGRLKKSGHNVTNVTLPGHANMAEYFSTQLSDYVTEVVDAMPTAATSVLIGHSMGGFVISQTASVHPARISSLVYVSAMMPSEGDTITSLSARAGTTFKAIKAEFEEAKVGPEAFGLQPPGPLDDPFVDEKGMATIPRHYIRCTSDTIIPPAFQDEMIDRWKGTTTVDIATGHLPQYTKAKS